jgi:hypothetical protein
MKRAALGMSRSVIGIVFAAQATMIKRASRPKRKPAKLRWLRNIKGKRVGLILPA